MSAQHTPMARYTLNIVADTGYESTTEGDCTPHQYSMAVAALMGSPHTSPELTVQCDELMGHLSACREAMPETHIEVNAAIANPACVPGYVRDSVAHIVAQRDALLIALETIAKKGVTTGCGRAALAYIARAAIDKYKGGAA